MNFKTPQTIDQARFMEVDELLAWLADLHCPWREEGSIRPSEYPFGGQAKWDRKDTFRKEEWLRDPVNAAWYYSRLELARDIWAQMYVSHENVKQLWESKAHAYEMERDSFKAQRDSEREEISAVRTVLREILKRKPSKARDAELIKQARLFCGMPTI